MKKLIIILSLLISVTTIKAEQHFAPKPGTYKKNSYKKHRKHKKDAFVCVRLTYKELIND